MASYGILGFMQGAGEAGAKAAEEAQRSHNENARLKMAEELADKRQAQAQDFQRETYKVQRADQVADLDRADENATLKQMGADALTREQLAAQGAISDKEFAQKKELEYIKAGNRPGNYSDIMVGVNKETGERDQFRVNNRTNEIEWLNSGAPTSPLDDVKLAKAEADLAVSQGKAGEIDAKKKKAAVLQDSALTLMNRILGDESDPKSVAAANDVLEANTGVIEGSGVGKFFTVRQSSKDFQNDMDALKKILTMDNMDALGGGVLSDSDILMLEKASAAGLDTTNGAKIVRDVLTGVRQRIREARGIGSEDQKSAGATGGWGGAQRTQAPKPPAPGTQYKNMSDEEFMKSVSPADLSDEDLAKQLGL